MATITNNPGGGGQAQTISVSGGVTVSIPAGSVTSVPQWMTRLKMEPGVTTTGNIINNNNNNVNVVSGGTLINTTTGVATLTPTTITGSGVTSLSLASMDCYEDMFKEITKKLYGDESLAAEVIDASGHHQNIIYETTDAFRTDGALTLVTSNGLPGLPPGTIFLQRRLPDDKGLAQEHQQVTITTTVPQQQQQQQQQQTIQQQPQPPTIEERWFESDEVLNWTTSKIARFNPAQKVFRCVDCDFVGFLSRVAEHWLGNHASLRVFQCPRCPYTSTWSRCVRMHLTRQHGETLTDNSLWKENPVLEEVTKFLTSLKTKVEQKGETSSPGEKRYCCAYCPYATDRRDLFNRHENIHREEKPFQCYVCEKQFNRADHVKKHFMRMHRDHPYDINRIRKHLPKSGSGGALPFFTQNKNNAKIQQQQQQQQQQDIQQIVTQSDGQQQQQQNDQLSVQLQTANGNQTVTLQHIPHIAYFNPPATPNQTGPLQGIQGVGGIKKEGKAKSKGQKKKKTGEKMYTCSYCPWQGVDNWCLKRHLNTHIKPFLCSLCDYKAARSERLATHVLKVHNKRVCHKCSFLADDTESLGQHIQDSHQNPLVKTGFNCNVCQEYFELRADLEAHAILEHQKVIVQCDLCDFRTTDELSMEAHLRDKHNLQPGMGAVAAAAAAAAAAAMPPGQNIQLSNSSGIQMTDQQTTIQIEHNQGSSVSHHLVTPKIEPNEHQHHHNQDKDINGNSYLGGQISSITTEEDSSLSLQDSSSFQKMDISIPAHSGHSGGDSNNGIMIEEIEIDSYCETCGCEFADDASLKIHQKRHSKNTEIDPNRLSNNVLRSYCCAICSYTSPTRKIMIQHWRLHTGFENNCRSESCHYSSPFDSALKEHILAKHNVETRCPHCGLKMVNITDFTLHWPSHHNHICSLCVNTYKKKYSMKETAIHELILKSQESLAENSNSVKINKELLLKGRKRRLEDDTSNNIHRLKEIVITSMSKNNNNIKKKRKRRRSWYGGIEGKKRVRNGGWGLNRGIRVRMVTNRGYKCYHSKCEQRPFSFVQKVSLILHDLWSHRSSYKCDNCEVFYPHLYQTFLHKLKIHQDQDQGQSEDQGHEGPHQQQQPHLHHHQHHHLLTQ